jgi:hypothetical protein
MPSYILRDIDPDLWTKAKARAEKEGHSLRWVIFQLLAAYVKQGLKALAIIVAMLLLSACAPPLAPSPVTVPKVPRVPASLTLTGGTATTANEVLLNLTVVDATGVGVPDVVVTLTTTHGTFNHASVATSPSGTGQALLTTTEDATVTATLGSLSATARATAYHVFEPPPSPPPPPPPVIVPPQATCANTPSLCPPPPPPALAVLLTCTPIAHGTPTPCNVNVTYGGTALPATAINRVDWNWGDGFADTTLPPTAPINTHAYTNAGSYTVFATVLATTVDGPKTATASKALMIP